MVGLFKTHLNYSSRGLYRFYLQCLHNVPYYFWSWAWQTLLFPVYVPTSLKAEIRLRLPTNDLGTSDSPRTRQKECQRTALTASKLALV